MLWLKSVYDDYLQNEEFYFASSNFVIEKFTNKWYT